MLKYLLLCFELSILVHGSLTMPGPQYPPTRGEVWPKPRSQLKEDLYYSFESRRFAAVAHHYNCDILKSAIKRYAVIFRHVNNLERYGNATSHRRSRAIELDADKNYAGNMKHLDIYLSSPCETYPYLGMDESYELVVESRTRLSSNSIWGILRGLETFSQLIYVNDDYTGFKIHKNNIYDIPEYPHRGLLLDTARHYISTTNIKRTLDAMAMNKMNVFHWHIVDDQSFPYDSELFPELASKGAYSYPSMIYTKADIQQIIEFARKRGIRVLPEFDVPGHTASWGVAYPNILTECYENKKVVGLGPMNPIKNETYSMLYDLIKEIQEWFPETYLHIGGDEVDVSCWKSNPELIKYMADNKLTPAGLHNLFMNNLFPLLGNKTKPIVWQDVYDEGVSLTQDTLIHVWKSQMETEMTKILRSGHRLIYSSSWYLDGLRSGGDWKEFYLADPREMVASRVGIENLLPNIVGGEACMWSEVVDDHNVFSRVWPRASAVAERLWSSPRGPGYARKLKPDEDVPNRLEEHTCRMIHRGIPAQPPNGPGYCL